MRTLDKIIYYVKKCHPCSILWMISFASKKHLSTCISSLLLIHLLIFKQIGNPLLKLDRDIPATYEYFWSHGMISDEIGLAIMGDCDFEDYVFNAPHNVSGRCNDAIAEANLVVGNYVNNYDVILDVCYPSIVEQELRLKKYVSNVSIVFYGLNTFVDFHFSNRNIFTWAFSLNFAVI